jgi:hypothetical protein
MPITKIISGGQTGADRGGWEAAMHCGMPYGGWVPKGRKAEDGVVPAKYEGLKESTSADYLTRTEANVVDSDATAIFTYGELTGGSLKTWQFAVRHEKPCIHVDLQQPREDAVEVVLAWLRLVCPQQCALNVAGSRESKALGIQQAVMVRMVDIISKANGKLFYPLREDGRGRN